MKNSTRPVSGRNRLVPVALLLVALPWVACNNSDSIGMLTGSGGAGVGGGKGGAGGAGTGGAPSGVGGLGAGGGATSQGGGSGGTQTSAGGAVAVGSGGQGGRDAASDIFQCPLTNVYCPSGYVLDAYGCTVCGPGPGGTGGQGGRDAAGDTSECVITDVYCVYGYVSDANGCPVCAPGPSGTGGAGGTGGTKSDAAGKLDVQASYDAQDLAALCISTGGQISSTSCCTSAMDFPDSCLGGACGCAPTYSHMVTTCICPTGSCFTAQTGCGIRGGGTGGSGGGSGTLDAAPDGNVVCGSSICTAGQYCCNAESSLCAPNGQGCIQ